LELDKLVQKPALSQTACPLDHYRYPGTKIARQVKRNIPGILHSYRGDVMPFRFIQRVLLTQEALLSFTIGFLVSVMICLGHAALESDRNATNRLFGYLIGGVILIAAVSGTIRVLYDSRHERSADPGFHGIAHLHHH